MRDKPFIIVKNPKYDEYEKCLASVVYKLFDIKSAGGTAMLANKSAIKNENISNKELPEELHKPIIKKFNKRKIQSIFIDNIWGAVLTDMQLISKFNKGIRFSLCVIDIFSKYAGVIPLKDKKRQNEEKSVVAEIFIRILKNKIYKKNVYIDKLDEIVNKYNGTYHRTIKMKPVDQAHILTLIKKIIKKVLNLKNIERSKYF